MPDASIRVQVRSGELTRSNLPGDGSHIVGRTAVVADALATLQPGRVLSITGFGGVGKTTLAVEVARSVVHDPDRFSDGVWFCELATIVDASSLPAAVADTLGIFQNDDATAYDSIVSGLRGLWSVLVLDNCEQLVGAAATFLQRLVIDCPDLAVLVTSREALRIDAEDVIALEPLDVEAAAQQLFVARALESDPSFDRLEHREAINDISRSLDGLPLALELAAARLDSMTAEQVAGRLDERFRLLRSADRTGRNDSLHATVSWSYELLEPVERRLFDRLSVFQDGFDERAAVAILDRRDRGVDVRDVLRSLVERSMITVVERGDAGVSRRYRILETLRQFGDRQLARRNERSAVRNQHLDHVIGMVAAANAHVISNDWTNGAKEFAVEWGNIRAAVNWAIDTTRVDDVDRLLRDVFFYCRWSLEAEAAVWAKRAISRGPTTGAAAGTPAYLHVAFQEFLAGEHEQALASLQAGLDATGTPSDRGWCRHYAAVELLYLGRAVDAAEQAVADFDDESPRSVESVMRSSSITTFQMYARRIRPEAVLERLDRDAALAQETGNAVAIGHVTYNRALCAYSRGDVDAYRANMDAALTIARRENISNLTGYVLTAQVYAPGWTGLRAALEALEYWASKRDIGNEFVVLEAAAINLAELRRLEHAAVILGNLQKDRRRIASSVSRREAALGEIRLHRKSDAWMESGAAMSRSAVLRFTKAVVIEALNAL